MMPPIKSKKTSCESGRNFKDLIYMRCCVNQLFLLMSDALSMSHFKFMLHRLVLINFVCGYFEITFFAPILYTWQERRLVDSFKWP